MPTTILLQRVIDCAKLLDSGHSIEMATGVRAVLGGGKLTITENGTTVFHMKVMLQGTHLNLDYPRTVDGQQGRGWGRLGLLLALRFGLHRGCTTVAAGTPLEPGSHSFWGLGKLQFSLKTNLQQAIIDVMLTIRDNVPQPSPLGTSVIVIRNPAPGSAAPAKRRNSLGK